MSKLLFVALFGLLAMASSTASKVEENHEANKVVDELVSTLAGRLNAIILPKHVGYFEIPLRMGSIYLRATGNNIRVTPNPAAIERSSYIYMDKNRQHILSFPLTLKNLAIDGAIWASDNNQRDARNLGIFNFKGKVEQVTFMVTIRFSDWWKKDFVDAGTTAPPGRRVDLYTLERTTFKGMTFSTDHEITFDKSINSHMNNLIHKVIEEAVDRVTKSELERQIPKLIGIGGELNEKLVALFEN